MKIRARLFHLYHLFIAGVTWRERNCARANGSACFSLWCASPPFFIIGLGYDFFFFGGGRAARTAFALSDPNALHLYVPNSL